VIAGIVLAAGRSTRLGRPKQTLLLDGRPLVSHVLGAATASTLDEVVLVLGYQADLIAGLAGEWGQRTVVNPNCAAGQSTSIHAGLAAIDPSAEAALILIGDQPDVSTDIIDAVLDAYRAGGGPIVQPAYQGVPGNPVLFRRDLFPELLLVTGDEGGRSVLRAHADSIVTVPIRDRALPRDVDTEEDYAALLAAW